MALSRGFVFLCLILVGCHGQGLKGPNRFIPPNCNFVTQSSVVCTNQWPINLPLTITELTIHGVSMPTITSIDIQKLPRTLSILRIYDCQVERLDPSAFEFFGINLRELDLGHNVISSIPPNLFSNIRRLQKIVLRNNRIATLNRGIFLGLNSLQSLDLSDNQLTQMPLDLPNQIQQLYLTNNPIARLDFLTLENLQTLNLCGTQIDEFPSGSQIKSTKLQVLCLGGRTLKSTSTGFGHLNQLTELTLIGEQGLSGSNMPHPVLNSLENCRNLQKLAIEKYSLPSLTVLRNFEQLHSLVLREVSVEERPTASIFRPLENLQVIDFSYSAQLAQQTVLVEEIRQTWFTVTSLILRNCQLNDLSWYPIQQSTFTILPSLISIDISGNPINCNKPHAQQVLCHFMGKNPDIDPRSNIPTTTTPNPLARYLTPIQPSYFQQNSFTGLQNMEETCGSGYIAHMDCPLYTTPLFEPSQPYTPPYYPPEQRPDQPQELTMAEKWYIVLGVILFLLAIITVVVIYMYCRKTDVPVSDDCEAKGVPSKTEEASKVEVQSFKALQEQDVGSTVNLVKE